MSATTETSNYASSDTNSSQGDESPNNSNLSGLEDKSKRLSREIPEQYDTKAKRAVSKAPSVKEVISHLHANSEAKVNTFNDWQDMEKSIMSANISSVRAKWLEREKGMLEKEKQARPASALNAKKKQFLSAALSKEDEDEKERPPSKVGNVFLFLQQKQKEVREEEVHEAKNLRDNLPPAPPIPIIVEPPKPVAPAPKETPASPNTQRKKQEAKKEKKEKKEKEKKEKKDKKDKKDKKSKEDKNKKEEPKLTTQKSTSEVEVSGLKSSGVHEKPPKEPYVLYDYVASDTRMISLTKGKQVVVVDKSFSTDWVHVECEGKSGLFPLNYLKMPSSGPKGFLEFFDESDEEENKKDKKAELSLQEGGIAALVMPTSPSQSRQPSLQNSTIDEDDDTDANLDPRVHLFEEADSEKNIIYKEDEQDSSSPGVVAIRGATLEKLLYRLTHEQIPDPEFVSSFLLTYSAITNPNELLDLLILRYRTPRPKEMDKETFKNKKRTPIRLRVINVLKLWIKKDFITIRESNVLPKMKDFIGTLMAKTLPSASKELLALIASKEDEKSNVPEIFVNKKPPKPIIPKKTSDLTLNDIHPEEVARQLTLIEHDLFKNIQSHECIKQKWLKDSKNLTPNIHRVINRFNQVSNWVASEVVQVEDLKLRAVTLNRFIFIAQKCFELNNFNAVMEILSALNCSAVHRLRQTWDLLPPKSMEVFEDLEILMNAEGNFAAYRECLKKAKAPVIPYLGLTLTDLVFISEGNPDIVPNTNLINWWKLNLIASVIKEMQQYQETPYALEKVEIIQEFILNRPNMTEDEMYKLSLTREERTKKKRATKDSE